MLLILILLVISFLILLFILIELGRVAASRDSLRLSRHSLANASGWYGRVTPRCARLQTGGSEGEGAAEEEAAGDEEGQAQDHDELAGEGERDEAAGLVAQPEDQAAD